MAYIIYQVLILLGMIIIYTLIHMEELDFGGMTPIMVLIGALYFCYTSYLHIYVREEGEKVDKRYVYFFVIPGILICLSIVCITFLKYY